MLILTGPSGIGQSHLLRDIKVRAQVDGTPFYLERGFAGRPVAPGSLLRCFSEHLDAEGRKRWQAFLSRLGSPHSDPASSRGETTLGEIRLRRGAEVAHAVRSLGRFFALAVDGLQLFDEISVDLLVDLVRFLLDGPRPTPLALLVGYREEGPSRASLRELTELVLRAASRCLLQIPPLGPAESLELYDLWRSRGGGEAGRSARRQGLAVFQTTGGIPARILELAQPEVGSPRPQAGRERAESAPDWPFDPEDQPLLVALSLLRKPAGSGELARILSVPRKRVERRLEALSRGRLARPEEGVTGSPRWLPGPGVDRRVRDASPREIRRIHRAIATEFLRRSAGSDDPCLLEAVHHLEAAGSKTLFVRHGLSLARYLRSTYQNRTALNLLPSIAAALPRGQPVARLRVALEIAELQGRIGAFTEGIDGLRKLSTRQKLVPPVWRRRLKLRLAMLYSRRGDFREAETLFRGGLGSGRDRGKARRELRRAEFLFFLNEFAAMLAVVGEYDEAIRLCDEGLGLAARNDEDAATREAILNFLATRAHVAMRHFRLADATADYERALQIAEDVGSLTNRAVLLNNLALVHAQSDRYAEAIRLYREAEKTCRQLDEGPSLTFVYGNLALLEAKTGDFAAMATALDEAEKLALGENPAFRRYGHSELGQREIMYLDHHRGLSLLYRGRYREARSNLERAIETGERICESYVTLFDRVYRAEALLFEGAHDEAMAVLRALADTRAAPPRLRLMAASRLALAAAWTGRPEELGHAIETHHAAIEDGPAVPFLDAWDDVYIAWALAISGDFESGRERRRRAEGYFADAGLGPASSLAAWVGAESDLLRGETSAAWTALETVWPSIRSREPALRERRIADNDLSRVLWPLLAARLFLEGSPGTRERARAADLLAEAEDALRQNPLPEWSRRLRALRRAFGHDDGSLDPPGDGPASRHWMVWTAPGREAADSDSGSEPVASERVADVETAALTRDSGSRAGLVAESPAMRRLVRALDRLRSRDLPVLLQGETGTGKEMVARILHSESARAGAPFRVLDCSTIPEGLLEVELFGALRGSFSDLTEDRPGILQQASGGTVLVDHVSELPVAIQAKLLRVISEGTIRALGSEEEERLDLRFLFSTSRDPEEQIAEGTLRRDLYHRMKIVLLRIPPLRERAEDVEGLVHGFLERHGPARCADGVIDRLRRMDWPGNVRQLENFVQRLAIECPGDITPEALRRTERDFGEPRTESRTGLVFPSHLLAVDGLSELKTRLERDYTVYHLRRLEGDVEALARFLGVSLKQAYRRCQKLGIRVREERRRQARSRREGR